jgi:glycosyltransferase involved in cell wall biosynthesis
MRSILYITYDGLTDPLGQSQILAYLKRLSALQNKIVILSFEKEELYRREHAKIKKIVDDHGLIWVPLRYTKRPPVFSTILDIQKGYRTSKQLHTRYRFQIVHCRGYIPAMLGRRLQKNLGLRFIFDMRGWWPDEKLESGYWDKKIYRPVYRYFKNREKEFFSHCDFAVSLTYKGKAEIERQQLAEKGKTGVIPTCVDFEIFKSRDENTSRDLRKRLGIRDHEKVFVYSGSLGGNYDPAILIAVFRAFQQRYPQSYLLILSKDRVGAELQHQFQQAGIERMAIYNAPFVDVTNYLRAADVGFIYYKMSFSTIGRSPTKMGEYWASGIPIISFKGIGDLDYILEKYPGGGVLLSGDEKKWQEEMSGLSVIDAETLRGYALNYFHVEKGVKFYQGIYEQLTLSSKTYERISNTGSF